jgi:hypothetical protein
LTYFWARFFFPLFLLYQKPVKYINTFRLRCLILHLCCLAVGEYQMLRDYLLIMKTQQVTRHVRGAFVMETTVGPKKYITDRSL